MLDAAGFRWREEGGGQATAARCLAFLSDVGIPTVPLPSGAASQAINGLAILGGALAIDPESTIWPGDLLHEAGHIAIVTADRRATMDEVAMSRDEELMAIAWSYAASRVCGVELRQLFHTDGYKGRSEFAASCYAVGYFVGADLLAQAGMAHLDLASALAAGEPTYPVMLRWLR